MVKIMVVYKVYELMLSRKAKTEKRGGKRGKEEKNRGRGRKERDWEKYNVYVYKKKIGSQDYRDSEPSAVMTCLLVQPKGLGTMIVTDSFRPKA